MGGGADGNQLHKRIFKACQGPGLVPHTRKEQIQSPGSGIGRAGEAENGGHELEKSAGNQYLRWLAKALRQERG